MKNILCISAIILLLCVSGCESDSDFFETPDNTPIKPFIDLGSDLNDYLWDVNFGRSAYSLGATPTQDEEDDYAEMLRDTLLQGSYCDIIYDTLQDFELISISDNKYTERSRKSTITVTENIFTLATEYYAYMDNPKVYEKVNAVMIYDNTLKTWILRIYRSQTNLWLLQEGAKVGNIWYVIGQLDDAGATYRTNYMQTGSDIPANARLSISGQSTSTAPAQGTLYTTGITMTNDDWAEFRSFGLVPGYEFTE